MNMFEHLSLRIRIYESCVPAQIAQLVEQWTENPRVAGSIPALGTFVIYVYGILAQLVEHLTFNQVVGGSNPPCLITVKKRKTLKLSVFPTFFM